MHRPSVEEISDKPPVRCVAAFSYIGNAAVQRDTLIQFAGSLAELRHDEESIRSDRIYRRSSSDKCGAFLKASV